MNYHTRHDDQLFPAYVTKNLKEVALGCGVTATTETPPAVLLFTISGFT
jgi:hypothetical protein